MVKDWETYFANATVRLEDKINTSKSIWCDRNFKNWVEMNKHRIEAKNIIKEVRVQTEGPRLRPALEKDSLATLRNKMRQRVVNDK